MNTKHMNKIIPINIWDDFFDDGFVPIGETQETYAYIEDDTPLETQKLYLNMFLQYMKENLNVDKVDMSLVMYEPRKKYPNLVGTENENLLINRCQIIIKGITHSVLHEWMKKK